MSPKIEQLSQDLLALPIELRAELAKRLIESLDDEEDLLPAEEVEALWMEEIHRRVEEFESGKVKGIPAEEVFRRIESRFS